MSGGDDSPVLACELFSGGYSGWMQVMRRLSRLGYPFAHKLALDVERDCCETFCKAHGIERIIGPESFVWGHDSLPRSLVVNGDISEHASNHLFSNHAFDIAVISPPCSPWSYASSFPGLMRADGRLTLHAWGLLSILKPRVLVMEMVSGMREHQHWKIIRSFVLWCGIPFVGHEP